MGKQASAWLTELDEIHQDFGLQASARKRELLASLQDARLPYREEVYSLHEILCFLRAYPDDRRVLKLVEAMLADFAERPDFQKRRAWFLNTGMAGASMYFAFYWFTARWLARHHPQAISIDWQAFQNADTLRNFLPLLLPYGEMHTLEDTEGYDARRLLGLLKGPDETDATFLIRRVDALPTDHFGKEALYEHIDPVLHLAPGPDVPHRTRARHRRSKVTYQTQPLVRTRPKLPQDLKATPKSVDEVSRREAERLIDLGREALIARERDLDVFTHADARDVRMIDWGDGLEFACLGAVPERRLLLDAVYGFLTLKNGVPIGYVLSNALFGSAGVAYNVFETFRGSEAGFVYGRVLAMLRHLFGVDSFFIDPYQLGHDNEEGQSTGAWWFYYKVGFRPDDAGIQKRADAELAKMRQNPRHRSSRRTLQALSAKNLYYDPGRPRADVLGRISLGNIGLAISRYLAKRFGADRETGIAQCAQEVADLTGLASWRDLTPPERRAWERWSPLALALGGLQRWSEQERHDLQQVIRAKGGRREADYQRLFDTHAKLRRGVAKLGRE